MNSYSKNNSKFYNLIKCITASWIYFILTFGFNNYIGMLNNDIFRTFFTFVFCMFFSYWSHRLSHEKFPILSNTYLHRLHHNTKYNKKWWAEIVEWIVNLIQIGGIILIPINMLINKYIGIKIFNNYSIVFFSIIYSLTHMISYHNLKVDTHINHHENMKNNYGPDFIDIIFDTKKDNTIFEDHNPYIINTLISFVIVIFLMKKKILH